MFYYKLLQKISTLFSLAQANDRIKHNNLHFIMNKEAEMIKMLKNCYLATKASFCNQIYQFCEEKQVNYEVVRAFSTADERILSSHTRVPGDDGRRGFGGTCFPKETLFCCNFCIFIRRNAYMSYIFIYTIFFFDKSRPMFF